MGVHLPELWPTSCFSLHVGPFSVNLFPLLPRGAVPLKEASSGLIAQLDAFPTEQWP